jgi:putative transposase
LVVAGLSGHMARQPRNEIEAGIHHVWARGVERRVIFGDDDDRRLYLRLLLGIVRKFRWRVLGYCLMPNHVHLCVETRVPNLGRGMHRMQGQYAQEFNRRYSRVGHLFQSRFGSRIVHDEIALARVVAYIAANPVAAALCDAPDDWDWSSHRAMLGGAVDPLLDVARLRAHLAPLGELRRTYAAMVEARLVSDGLRGPG